MPVIASFKDATCCWVDQYLRKVWVGLADRRLLLIPLDGGMQEWFRLLDFVPSSLSGSGSRLLIAGQDGELALMRLDQPGEPLTRIASIPGRMGQAALRWGPRPMVAAVVSRIGFSIPAPLAPVQVDLRPTRAPAPSGPTPVNPAPVDLAPVVTVPVDAVPMDLPKRLAPALLLLDLKTLQKRFLPVPGLAGVCFDVGEPQPVVSFNSPDGEQSFFARMVGGGDMGLASFDGSMTEVRSATQQLGGTPDGRVARLSVSFWAYSALFVLPGNREGEDRVSEYGFGVYVFPSTTSTSGVPGRLLEAHKTLRRGEWVWLTTRALVRS